MMIIAIHVGMSRWDGYYDPWYYSYSWGFGPYWGYVHVGVMVIMIHSMTPSMIHGIIADITAMDIPIMVMLAGMVVGIVHGITAAIMAIHIMVAM